jgi:hypothetical protein
VEKFLFWLTIVIWVIAGFASLYMGKEIPPANVFSVAACFMWLYQMKENKRGG